MMRQGPIQVLNSPGHADHPWVEVDDHHSTGLGAVAVQPVEGVHDNLAILINQSKSVKWMTLSSRSRSTPSENSSPSRDVHPIGLLVVGPVADVPNAFRGEQVRRASSTPGTRGPATRPVACPSPSSRPQSIRGCTTRSSSTVILEWMARLAEMPCAMTSRFRFWHSLTRNG